VKGPIVLCAGGTGGHLFPAEAVASVLQQNGARVALVTDSRALRYGGQFPADAIHSVPAATPSGGSLLQKAFAIAELARGTLAAHRLLRRIGPAVVVGFGGYPTVPPLLAAGHLSIATIIHEQNAVMGRANRFLAPRVSAIATGFATLASADPAIAAKLTYVGNPVRPAVLAAAAVPFPQFTDHLKVLVTGGSQGARIMSDVVPEAIAQLRDAQRSQLQIVQQARAEDIKRVVQQYRELNVRATVDSFFADLPQHLAAAHLLIGRAGASTISECTVIGRPAILVPLPGSLDQDQAANAAFLAAAGAATVIAQTDFTPKRLGRELAHCLDNFGDLRAAAAAARKLAIADASSRLAELIVTVAGTSEKLPMKQRHETAA
jgi:UDP-N-acetylglucosamine--N-acetylmuramyl-(pentapeptide) pyrophosphoryl-undecaprenol N-acetylglucosamine transferase